MRTKTNLSRQHCSTELERFSSRLSTLNLSPSCDLDNLLSYLTASFTSISPHFQIEMSSSDVKNDEDEEISDLDTTNNSKDLNHFKFGSTIRLAYPCDMIASNGRSILSYVIEKNFLNYSTINGQNLSSNKVYRLLAPITGNNSRLWDMTWCRWSQFYVM